MNALELAVLLEDGVPGDKAQIAQMLRSQHSEIERLKGTLQDVRGHYERVCSERDKAAYNCTSALFELDAAQAAYRTMEGVASDLSAKLEAAQAEVETIDFAESIRGELE